MLAYPGLPVDLLWNNWRTIAVMIVTMSKVALWILLLIFSNQVKKYSFAIAGTCPEKECCVDGGCENISSDIDMKRVCYDVNSSNCGVESIVSDDPGRYFT